MGSCLLVASTSTKSQIVYTSLSFVQYKIIMKESFSKGALDKLNSNGNNKYYVYRLIDPRSFQTFYVGKGWVIESLIIPKAAMTLISVKGKDLLM